MISCKSCPNLLPNSKKPNKTGLCNGCYKKSYYKEWIKANNRTEYRKQYSIKNRERLTKNKNIKYKTDINFRLKESLRTRLSKAIRRNTKSGSAITDLGCSVEQLKKHLESKFQTGMNWDNYGKWEIDHITPLMKFNLFDEKEFQKACHYTNLQPLWKRDHKEKTKMDII